MSIKNNEPAFPHHAFDCMGMTLRDYFAAKAMQSIILKAPFLNNHEHGDDACDELYDAVARGAYSYADAMMKARGE